MAMTFICPRCGACKYTKFFDTYGPMCADCKKSGRQPSVREKEIFGKRLKNPGDKLE